jgi:hypothetical protein
MKMERVVTINIAAKGLHLLKSKTKRVVEPFVAVEKEKDIDDYNMNVNQ